MLISFENKSEIRFVFVMLGGNNNDDLRIGRLGVKEEDKPIFEMV